ncbi:hypothetical protein SynROS8604_03533 [Synechococcus sp. ROS8604]|nr:hypothetical protein SynROS8604_03533 [Synechococcus sp. ROS8604]
MLCSEPAECHVLRSDLGWQAIVFWLSLGISFRIASPLEGDFAPSSVH